METITYKTIKLQDGSVFIKGHRYNDEFDGVVYHEHNEWLHLPQLPAIVRTTSSTPDMIGIVLKDEKLASEIIPLRFPLNEILITENDMGFAIIKEKYHSLLSLYRFEFAEYKYEEINAIFEVIFDGVVYVDPNSGSIKLHEVNQKEVVTAVIPIPIRASAPCEITSANAFNYIRQYILGHIDTNYAKVTSNYDFVVRVSKIIPLHTNIVKKTEILTPQGKHYHNKRYTQSIIKDRDYCVFEMFNDNRTTPKAPTFEGDNLRDLEHKLLQYCENLMTIINEPLTECPYCDGRGIVPIPELIKIPERITVSHVTSE